MGRAFVYGQSGTNQINFLKYSGKYEVFGDKTQGYMMLYSSGTLTPNIALTIDVFIVGGGQGGSRGSASWGSAAHSITPGSGGGSGKTRTIRNVALTQNKPVSISIGNGGRGATEDNTIGKQGGTTSFGTYSVDGGGKQPQTNHRYGGNGGSGGGADYYYSYDNKFGDEPRVVVQEAGRGGCNGENGESNKTVTGGTGQGTTTSPFEGDCPPFNHMLYAGGGAGGGKDINKADTIGGVGGGGKAVHQDVGENGSANTGGGGAGGGAINGTRTAFDGGNGGSGICIIRWGY